MQLFRCFCIVISIMFAPLAKGQTVFCIEGNNHHFNHLNNHLYILPHVPPLLTFRQLKAKKQAKFRLYKSVAHLAKASVIWAKIQIRNKWDRDFNGILVLGKRYINVADVYIEDKQGNIVIKKAGGYVPGSQKDLNVQRIIPKVRFYLKPGQLKTVYIRFQNFNQKPLTIGLKLQTQEHWGKFIQNRNLVQGGFQGAIGLILLYNLFLFILSRDRVYMYYSAYLFCTGAYFFNYVGFSTEFIFPECPILFYDVYLLTTTCLQIFYLQFIRVFLNTREIAPFWDRFMVLWIIGRLAELLCLEVMLHTSGNFALIHDIHRQYALIEMGFFLMLVVVWVYIRAKMAIYLIAGVFCLYLGMSIGILKASYDGNLYFQGGGLLEILCFSLGLGHRMRLNERAKREAQKELIGVQEHANRYLEETVQKRTEQLNKLNDELNMKNEDLHASMRYAHKLQKGVLPYDARIQQLLPEHFILYRPRDIVSGDFYWVEEMDKKIIVVVADCTGHGIPGAMMSMLGSTALTDIILNKKITEADIILNKLSKVIESILRQDKNQRRDGMDIGICIIDKQTNILEFAGAHHCLYYFRAGKMNIVKGSRMSIGGFQRDKVFEKNTIGLEKDMLLYMCSDGFQDQFGGPNVKKFLSSRFKKLLIKIHSMPLIEQKEIMECTLDQWMGEGNSKQTDDILVWGAKI